MTGRARARSRGRARGQETAAPGAVRALFTVGYFTCQFTFLYLLDPCALHLNITLNIHSLCSSGISVA